MKSSRFAFIYAIVISFLVSSQIVIAAEKKTRSQIVIAAEKKTRTASVEKKTKTVGDYVEKELLVKFKLGENEKGNEQIRKIGAKILEKLSKLDVSRLSLPKGLTVEKAAEFLSKLKIVEFAEPNHIQKKTAEFVVNDPRYKEQWGLTNIGAPAGWNIHKGKSQTIIAVVDTGVDLNHPDFKGKLVSGYNYIENNNKPQDDEGHGTHCAGIAAASTGNGVGIAGVCPNCSIMPIRGLDASGKGTTATVAKGIIYAADNGAKVISMSFGGPAYSTTLKDAIDYAAKKGVVLIAAAGNENVTSPFYPAYLDPCISVGAITEYSDKRASFSNYGDWVHVAAPGSDILSTYVGGGYVSMDGTSMAAPFVAGLAGLMVSCSGASADKIRKALLSSSIPIGSWLSSGKIDVPKALAAVGCQVVTPNPSTPSKDDTPKPPTDDATKPSSGDTVKPSIGDSVPPKTPIVEIKEGQVTGYQIVHGRLVKETENALLVSDNNRILFGSKASGMTSFLDLNMTVKLKEKTSYSNLKVDIEGYSENSGSFDLFMMGTSSNQWVKVGSIRLEASDSKIALEVPNAEGYVSNTGEVKIRVYRTEKLWNGFEIGLNYVFVSGQAKGSVPDSKTPDAKTPDAKTPDAKTPDAKTPDAKTPDAKTPDAKTPDAKAPENKQPESGDKSNTDKVKDWWNSIKKKL